MSIVRANSYYDASGGSNAQLYGVASPPNSMGNRNRIINGDMRIDQRNAGAAVTINTTSVYTVDRWSASESGDAVFTIQQDTVAPTGFTNSAKITITTADASVGASQYNSFQQRIEGTNIADLMWGTANAKTVTLSFWVRSSVTGTFGGALDNSAYNRSYPFTYSISAANTWEQKTVTIPGDTSGTWLTTTGTGIQVYFDLGSGVDNTGTAGSWVGAGNVGADSTVQLVNTLNATWYITGVQLEAGTVASAFERRDYGRELMMCQRYYWRNTAGAAYTTFGVGTVETATSFPVYIKLPVTMRAVPTANFSTCRGTDGSNSTAVSSFGTNYSSTDTLNPYVTCTGASFTVGRAVQLQANNSTSAWIDASAEL